MSYDAGGEPFARSRLRGPAAERADGLPSVRPGAGRLPAFHNVKLTDEDRRLAADCADVELAKAKRYGMADRFGTDSWRSHYVGSCGEIGFARFLRVPWRCHPNDIGGVPDVGGYQVRTVDSDKRHLYVKAYEKDKPTTRIAACALAASTQTREDSVIVIGWITAEALRAAVGRKSDPGNRGAPAWMLYDLTLLSDDWREA